MAATANSATADQASACLGEFSASGCTHLALSLQKFNGGLHYQDNFVGLALEQISSVGDAGSLKAQKIVPFARDEMDQDSLLCVQVGEAGDSVVGYDLSSSAVTEQTGMSYGQYLESMRQKLLTKKLVYEDGLGLVSVA
uniref:Uncharacterized protein n=1 Tax=Favella ehrenbergii TaxID=182087 RepID=A0A7S3MNV3_9SPIT|mmetsp:Transcript_36377/g.44426  ORF Transcript_36377/g.44426 Transcript_36377/m.44426 type:complete len:139 (+) Transcript_36377:163-579(+)